MIPKVTFPKSNGVISESTVFAREEVLRAAKTIAEAIESDKKNMMQAAINYRAQFFPVMRENMFAVEDAIQSYAISHNAGIQPTAIASV